MEYYKMFWQKYSDFRSRSTRTEYWMFILCNFIVGIAIGIIEGMLRLKGPYGIGIITILYTIASIVPSIALTVRRLHDTSHSGWWALICLVPIVGWLVLLVFALTDSTPGDNMYGPNPKGPLSS
ncbi:MAG: DUF805 domain-containing protein [bacterium]